jgi:hypothetical protein
MIPYPSTIPDDVGDTPSDDVTDPDDMILTPDDDDTGPDDTDSSTIHNVSVVYVDAVIV